MCSYVNIICVFLYMEYIYILRYNSYLYTFIQIIINNNDVVCCILCQISSDITEKPD